MMNIPSADLKAWLLLLIFLPGMWGCTSLFQEEASWKQLREAAGKQMLKLQTSELMTETAQERFQPAKAAQAFAQSIGYQEKNWPIDKDPALQILEDAIVYALIALSADPLRTAEKIAASKLDYNVALRLLKIRQGTGAEAADAMAELAMMTGWDSQKLKNYAGITLPVSSIQPFPLYPDAEQMLNEKGSAAAFQAAARLYRDPDDAGIRAAERLRRALLNRVLMQTKSPGAEITPELRTASMRSRLFDGLLKGI